MVFKIILLGLQKKIINNKAIIVKKTTATILILYFCLWKSIVFSQSCIDESTCTIPSNTTSINLDNKTSLTIASDEVIRIDNMNGGGIITNYGILYLPNGNVNWSIINYNTIIITGNPVIQNKSSVYNAEIGKICVISNNRMYVNNGSYIVNDGQIKIENGLHFNEGAHLFNAAPGCMFIGSDISIDANSTHCNSGSIMVGGNITVRNGGSFSACEGFAPGGSVNNENNTGNYNLTCTSCIGPLGITVSDFYVRNEAGGNVIYWKTFRDRNVDYYLLQHSSDGISWQIIHNETTTDENDLVHEHRYTHKSFSAGENYYRLVQVDVQGISEISDIVYINNDLKKIVQRVNLLGQPVDEYYRGIIIIQYEDGSIEKIYKNQ